MSKKQKKDKKAQKAIHALSFGQLLDQARSLLESGKARDAIDLLKLAEKKWGASETLRLLLFRAYRIRETQLRAKDMIQEADVVRRNLAAVLPPLQVLSEADVIGYLSDASVEEAVRFHQSLPKDHSFCGMVERQIAYRLMATNNWGPLERLASDHPLRQSAEAARKAIDLMNAGNWESALEELKPVSRRSPYAPLRLFCKAMTLFLAENDDELLRVLPKLPSDFPLNPILEDIRDRLQGTAASTPRPTAGSLPQSSTILWDHHVHAEHLAQEILQALKQKHPRSLPGHVTNFARTIFPEDPASAILHLLECMWAANAISLDTILEMRQQLTGIVPTSDYDILIAKLDLWENPTTQKSTFSYCNLLEKSISDPVHRKYVQSMIYLFTAKTLYLLNERYNEVIRENFVYRMAMQSYDKDRINKTIMDMALQSIELDPSNRDAYSFLVKLPNDARETRDTIEKALLTMASTFPDDPYPCLELSTLYYRKNAFRKAEKILDEAARRAPHDRRVIERRALSLVIAACKNFNRSRMDRVFQDLERAESLDCRTLAPLIEEKRILFHHLLNQPSRLENLTYEDIPDRLSTVDRLRVFGLLVQETREREDLFQRKHIQAVQDRLGKAIQNAQLDPDAIVELLSPFPNIYQPILPKKPIAYPLLCAYKKIWKDFSNEKLIDTFLLLFHLDIVGFMANEMQQRIRKKNTPQHLLMRFFLVTLNYMQPITYIDECYENILSNSKESDRKELERLSRRLGAHANGILKECLLTFDFEPVECFRKRRFHPEDPLFQDDDDMPDWEEGDFFDDDYDEEDLEDMASLLAELMPVLEEKADQLSRRERKEFKSVCEAFIDGLNLTGKPYPVILSKRRKLRAKAGMCEILDDLARFVQIAGITDLSREAKTLLFGNESNPEQLPLPF